MSKKASEKQLNRFRRDAAILRRKYSNDEMAKKLDVNPANFSSYCSGAKNPGEDFLNKFYMVYADELTSPPYESDAAGDQSSTTGEASLRYLSGDNKEDRRTNFDKIVETNSIMAKSHLHMSISNEINAKSTYLLAQSNNYLIMKNVPRRVPRKSPRKPE